MSFLDSIKLLKREKMVPSIAMRPGDSIVLHWTDEKGERHKVLEHTCAEYYTISEAVVFSVDDEIHRGLGGAFLERKNEATK